MNDDTRLDCLDAYPVSTPNLLPLAAVRAIKEEAEKATKGRWMYEDGNSPHPNWASWVAQDYPSDWDFIAASRANVPTLCDTIETLVEALRLAVDSPHEVHNKAIAELLATINPPSAEAQTEGDGG